MIHSHHSGSGRDRAVSQDDDGRRATEKAVGYTTVGGDLEGGLAVIANVPKTVVVALLERLHHRFGLAACSHPNCARPFGGAAP